MKKYSVVHYHLFSSSSSSSSSICYKDETNNNNSSTTKDEESSLSLWDLKWQKQLQSLKTFVKEHGHAQVPVNYAQDPSLGRWLAKQRLEYRKKQQQQQQHEIEQQQTSSSAFNDSDSYYYLSNDKQQALEELGVIWNVRTDQWEEQFQAYSTLLQQYGHLDIMAHATPELQKWCNTQRTNYRKWQEGNNNDNETKTTTTNHDNDKDNNNHHIPQQKKKELEEKNQKKERIKKLNQIGFPWDMHQAYWDEKYKELCLYKKLNNHCLVLYKENPALNRWIDDQRQQYKKLKLGKKSSMTSERLKLLQEIHFIWDAYDYKWNLQYEELVNYKHRHHNNNKMPAPTSKLGRWIQYQIELYNQEQQQATTTSYTSGNNNNHDDDTTTTKNKMKKKKNALTQDRIAKLRSIGVLLPSP